MMTMMATMTIDNDDDNDADNDDGADNDDEGGPRCCKPLFCCCRLCR